MKRSRLPEWLWWVVMLPLIPWYIVSHTNRNTGRH